MRNNSYGKESVKEKNTWKRKRKKKTENIGNNIKLYNKNKIRIL